jgi:16S rRNA (uracil1498-N3)-methyltransferase
VGRFYASTLTAADETIALDDDEASHLVRVLRIEPGREVRVFNGRGLERVARVELADKRGVVLRIVGEASAAPELPFPLVLAQAVLKGVAMDQVIRDAVMLGVSSIAPIVSARTDGSLSHIQTTRRVDRWQRIAISSAKQCGRATVPEVSAAAPFGAMFDRPDHDVLLLAEPGAWPDAIAVGSFPRGRPSRGVVVSVGPEGGWAPEEVARARERGARGVTLGALTLRADAAAVVALPVLRYVWDAL